MKLDSSVAAVVTGGASGLGAATARALAAKGVKVLKQPEKVFWGGYSSYIADPDENLWEIAYNPFLPLEEHIDSVKPNIH